MTEESEIDENAPREEGRLARWSRLKAEQHKPVALAQDSEIAVEPEQSLVTSEPAESEQDLPPDLTDSDMPALHTLGAGSDFSGFMSPGVSEELRKLALRKMFALPSYHLRDGLDDYDDDYTVFEPLGDTVTRDPWSYRQEKLAEERAAADAAGIEQARLPESPGEEKVVEENNIDSPELSDPSTGVEPEQQATANNRVIVDE